MYRSADGEMKSDSDNLFSVMTAHKVTHNNTHQGWSTAENIVSLPRSFEYYVERCETDDRQRHVQSRTEALFLAWRKDDRNAPTTMTPTAKLYTSFATWSTNKPQRLKNSCKKLFRACIIRMLLQKERSNILKKNFSILINFKEMNIFHKLFVCLQ